MKRILMSIVLMSILMLSGCNVLGDKEFTVIFDTDEGTEVESVTISRNGKLYLPKSPTKEGYSFVDWYTDTSFDTSYDFGEPIVTDTTVYAKWEVNMYSITFLDYDDTLLETTILYYGDVITIPEDPTRDGYNFVGWNQEIPDTVPGEDIVVIAEYEEMTPFERINEIVRDVFFPTVSDRNYYNL